MTIEKICKSCHRIFLSHLLKHLEKLHSLSLCKIDVTVDRVPYLLYDTTKCLIRQTESKFPIYTVDDHWHSQTTFKIHLYFILNFDPLQDSSFINSQWMIMLHYNVIRPHKISSFAMRPIRLKPKTHRNWTSTWSVLFKHNIRSCRILNHFLLSS